MIGFEYSEGSFSQVNGGSYPATIASVEEVVSKFQDDAGATKMDLQWTLDLGAVQTTEGKVEPVTLRYYTPRNPTARNKLGKLIAATGRDPKTVPGAESLIGARLLLMVSLTPRSDGDGFYNKVEGVSLAPAAQGQAPAPATSAPPPAPSPQEWAQTAQHADALPVRQGVPSVTADGQPF